MSEKRSTWTGLWHELQRRHVVRVTLGYAAVAFVVLQMGEIILPAFTDDPVMMQVLVVVAVLLFPVVIALAWVYEVTPRGIRRMAEIDEESGHVGSLMPVFPRLAFLVVTLVVVGATGWWVVNTGRLGAGDQNAGRSESFFPAVALTAYNPDEPIRSLAVLALDNFSEEGGQDFFSASLHEAIVAQLSQLSAVRVVSRTSAMRYAGTNASIPQIGAELGVDAVVEGSVTRVGGDVRVTVRLIDAASDTEIWTEQYDGKLDDMLALQRKISEAIATAIQGELLPEERESLMAYRDISDDMEANEAMMKGRTAAEGGTQSDLMMADEFFDDVIALDPAFAPAYAERARVQLELGMLAGDTAAFMAHLPRAVELVEHAMELNAESPEVQAVWHFVRELAGGESAAGQSGGDAIAAPGSTDARSTVTSTVTMSAEGPEVVVLSNGTAADSIDGLVILSSTELGRRLETRFGEWAMRSAWGGGRGAAAATVHAAETMARLGQTDEALELMGEIRRNVPEFVEAWDATERILASQERYDEIIALRWERAEAFSDDGMGLESLQEGVHAQGSEGYWGWRLEELGQLIDGDEPVSHVDFALAYLKMGDGDGALDHLEVAARQGDQRLIRERNNPAFDPLRSEPRFRRLMAGLGRRVSPGRPGRRSGPPGDRRHGNDRF